MKGRRIVSQDGHDMGAVVAERGDCIVFEHGHLRHARHAVPRSFLHEEGDVLHATVAKEILAASPEIDGDDWSCDEILLHYGLGGPYVTDPDPELDDATGGSADVGPDTDPAQRIETLGDQ